MVAPRIQEELPRSPILILLTVAPQLVVAGLQLPTQILPAMAAPTAVMLAYRQAVMAPAVAVLLDTPGMVAKVGTPVRLVLPAPMLQVVVAVVLDYLGRALAVSLGLVQLQSTTAPPAAAAAVAAAVVRSEAKDRPGLVAAALAAPQERRHEIQRDITAVIMAVATVDIAVPLCLPGAVVLCGKTISESHRDKS